MKLKCIIVDDEPLAVDLLKTYTEQTHFLDLTATFINAVSALECIQNEDINLIFLDINMPKINGLEFSKIIPANVKIVFTTAYDQYAIEGFKINALDYLLKPISYAEFLQSAQRALDWFKLLEAGKTSNIFIKSGYQVKQIDLSTILYIENQKDYVEFYIEGAVEPVASLMSLQSLDGKLPADSFMRIHRSFIVNLKKVKTVERNCVIFGKKYIPVSETYRDKFQKFLNRHIL